MLGTFANLPDLPRQLNHAHQLLKPGGILFFNVPVVDSWIARLYGQNYWMYAPSVSNFLSRKGCRMILDRTGFQVEKMRTDCQQPTLSKLLGHAKLQVLYPLFQQLRWLQLTLPMALPIPGVMAVWARKAKGSGIAATQ
ncbi:hypothetical protein DO97_16110 [Neosynechococcus sphagnicola sy1]|uniref:Methyltransferase type 11 domain-containing protein n=2 Tax=Neosynechococcus TaxID=1501143 RepID=A0A098TLH5_9CYAN|nr:hypothetical protein DO97_16110 [Neosynechococcus sphagnicola sy1]